MKHYVIHRDLGPDMTWEKIDAGAVHSLITEGANGDRAIAWVPEIAEVSWVRSYWAPETPWAVCHYTGPSHAAVQLRNDLCETAYLRIREVAVIEADDIEPADYPNGHHSTSSDAPLLAVESAVGTDSPPAPPHGYRWIRTLRNGADGEDLHIFQLLQPAGVDEAPLVGSVHRVAEVRPTDYM